MGKLSVRYHFCEIDKTWHCKNRPLKFFERLGYLYPRLTTLPIVGGLFQIHIDNVYYVDEACVGYTVVKDI